VSGDEWNAVPEDRKRRLSKPMTNQRKYAKARERPALHERDQAGFYGSKGHAPPTPPGGEHPGRSPDGATPAARHPDDYDDHPSDPRLARRRDEPEGDTGAG
jgi:hypothetical protein